MTVIDRAFEFQMKGIHRSVWLRLTAIENQIIDASDKMRDAWMKICEVEGIADPYDLTTNGNFIPTEKSAALAETLDRAAKVFAEATREHKTLCRQHGIQRPILLKRGS